MEKKYEAVVLDDASARVRRMFASDSLDDAEKWFCSSYRDETGREPSADEMKYFADGHDVSVGSLTWRLRRK